MLYFNIKLILMYFVIILLIIIIYIYVKENNLIKIELFDTNLFFKPMPNIFLGSNYLNYDLKEVKKVPEYNTLGQISYDSYINSDIVSTKIICSNYNNQGDCWDNNHCQWIYKIDGGSYCDMAPKWLL